MLEVSLLTGLRAAFEGDIIPKNPYPTIIRSLNYNNLQKMVLGTFTELTKYITKNVTEKPGNYQLTTIKARPFFYGLPHVLEWVDVDKLDRPKKIYS